MPKLLSGAEIVFKALEDQKVEYIFGGDTRQTSVFNALMHADETYRYVITHDAARPNVSEDDIANLLSDIIKSESSCSYLYTPVYDSIKETKTKDKNKFHLVQTPQISNFSKLRSSLASLLEEGIDIPDESFAMERKGFSISRLKGRSSNIKITNIEELQIIKKFSRK